MVIWIESCNIISLWFHAQQRTAHTRGREADEQSIRGPSYATDSILSIEFDKSEKLLMLIFVYISVSHSLHALHNIYPAICVLCFSAQMDLTGI